MEVFIFGVILILILIPILYIVPIGFNKKEKVLIAGLSFILAEIGLLANKFLSLWKSVLILLLLALLATYFFETRLRPRLEKRKGKDKRSLKSQSDSLEMPKNELKLADGLPNEEVHKDFGDFNLGQDAIDRLLFEKKQAALKNDDSISILPLHTVTEESPEHLQVPIEEPVTGMHDDIEEESGIIEDSYNNPELFSDFVEVQQLEDKREMISEQEEPEEDLNEIVIEDNGPFAGNDVLPEVQDVVDILPDEVFENDAQVSDDIVALLPDHHAEDVDLEDLLSGHRFDKEDIVVDSKDDFSDVETVDEVDLLQRRASLFDELEGESIVENADLFVDDEQDSADGAVIEEMNADIQSQVMEEPLEDTTLPEELEEVDTSQDASENIEVEPIIEDMEVIDEIPSLEENGEISEKDAELHIEEHDVDEIPDILEIIGESENVEDATSQYTDEHEEKMDIHEYISTSVNTDDNGTISNDVEEGSDILYEAPEQAVEVQIEQVMETKTQQRMLQTMLDYINVSKQSLSAHQYEELVRAHMQSELSDHDYFTFAYLLIEHYISQGQQERLFDLLQNLDSKFSKYPILKQQINYLIERYC
ncbi:hypothetical protein ACNQFZ_16075 [Schinkia sp. CFF1]